MKTFRSTSLALLLLATLLPRSYGQQREIGVSAFHKNDITYSTEVVTPHVAWASKLPAGPIKSFFIPSVEYGRDMVELMERLQLEPTTVSIDREWDINCWASADNTGTGNGAAATNSRLSIVKSEKTWPARRRFEGRAYPASTAWARLRARPATPP